jgi:putative acetyltransferase
VIAIRPERPDDTAQVRRVNELAFGQPTEADLVQKLRQACTTRCHWWLKTTASWVTSCSPVVVESAARSVIGMGLAPMAVLPDRQRQDIGSQLVERGLDTLRERSCPFVVVVGHPEYYPRFGFEPASPQYTPTVVVAANPRNGRTPLTPSQEKRSVSGSRSPSSRSRKPGMKNSFVSVVNFTRPAWP